MVVLVVGSVAAFDSLRLRHGGAGRRFVHAYKAEHVMGRNRETTRYVGAGPLTGEMCDVLEDIRVRGFQVWDPLSTDEG